MYPINSNSYLHILQHKSYSFYELFKNITKSNIFVRLNAHYNLHLLIYLLDIIIYVSNNFYLLKLRYPKSHLYHFILPPYSRISI